MTGLLSRPFAPCKCFHAPTLDHLQIAREVEQLFTAIGWERYLVLDYPTFEELCYEFYSTFDFTKNEFITLDEQRVIKFKLRGTPQDMSINDFNLLLGFVSEDTISSGMYRNSACDYTRSFSSDYIDIWREWSTDPQLYDLSQSKASYLKDPVLKVIHRFLAYNFSGRKDASGNLAKAEFYFLWCMRNKIQVNFRCWAATQM